MKGYLGIDESNHGRVPEVIVGVYSRSDKEILEHKDRDMLSKRRKDTKYLPDISKVRFKFVRAYQEHRDMYGDDGIKLIAISQLISAFGDLELVLIDGELNSKILKKIKKAIRKNDKYIPTLKTVIEGDRKYPIVNKADLIAHRLFRQNEKLKNGEELFPRREIPFDPRQYENLLLKL